MIKKRKKRYTYSRNMFSMDQIEILENVFEQTHYPDSLMRERLSNHLGIDVVRLQVWFQNRRAKFRKLDPKNSKHHSIQARKDSNMNDKYDILKSKSGKNEQHDS
jgi:hypothetical protein